MNTPLVVLQDRSILNRILKFSQINNFQVFIVGGFLRDIILGRKRGNIDIDFAVKNGAIKLSSDLAKYIKAGFVVLDKVNGCARLIKRWRDRVYTLDFADFRSRDLLQDLSKRDFSINTLAIELETFLNINKKHKSILKLLKDELIDPFHGIDDLKLGIIRVVNNCTFDDDPLRILRAFSLSCLLNFQIEPHTLKLAKQKRRKLREVSHERIRDELFKILSTPRSYEFVVQLDRYGILELFIPEIKAMRRLDQGGYHHLDVWGHTMETIRQLEIVIKNYARNRDIQDYLDEEISYGRCRRQLIKLAALLHDIGKPRTLRIDEGKIKFHGHERLGSDMLEGIARRLRLSNDEIARLKKIVLLHLRPGYLADNPILTRRAKFRFFRDATDEAISILLISLADQRATQGFLARPESRRRHERIARHLIREYFGKKSQKKHVRLINGNDLLRRFKLEPSPLIGRVLSAVEEMQAIGKIKTKKEAFKIAENIIGDVKSR